MGFHTRELNLHDYLNNTQGAWHGRHMVYTIVEVLLCNINLAYDVRSQSFLEPQ